MNCVYLPKKIFFFFLPFLPSFLATNDDEFDCFAFHSIFSPFHAIQHSEWFNFLSPYGILHSIRPMMGTSSDIRFAIYSSPMSSPLKRTKKKKLFSCCFHYTNRNFYRIIFFFFLRRFISSWQIWRLCAIGNVTFVNDLLENELMRRLS